MTTVGDFSNNMISNKMRANNRVASLLSPSTIGGSSFVHANTITPGSQKHLGVEPIKITPLLSSGVRNSNRPVTTVQDEV